MKRILITAICCVLLLSTSGCASFLAGFFDENYTAGDDYRGGTDHFDYELEKRGASSWGE
jgi:hypothetical protein